MKIIVFTGAGISKDSGLDTFRRGGLWDGMSVREVAYADRWHMGDPARQKMLDFYNIRRRQCLAAEPNAAHRALAELENAGHDVTVITQNVDDLHERGGSLRVIHLHGELMKVRSENDPGHLIPWSADCNLGDRYQGVQLRPHVVWFGEDLPQLGEALEIATAPDVDSLMIVGTTLEVGPANLCAFCTRAKRVFIVDPEPPEFEILDDPWRSQSMRPHPDVTILSESAALGVPRVVEILATEPGIA